MIILRAPLACAVTCVGSLLHRKEEQRKRLLSIMKILQPPRLILIVTLQCNAIPIQLIPPARIQSNDQPLPPHPLNFLPPSLPRSPPSPLHLPPPSQNGPLRLHNTIPLQNDMLAERSKKQPTWLRNNTIR